MIHWVGTGLSTGSGVGVLAERYEVALYGRTREKAAACVARLGLTGRVEPRSWDDLRPTRGDVVVSMLPATEHVRLLRLSIDAGAHYANTSYVSDEIAAYADAAREAGVVLLTEAGLDPGLDHLLAHDLVERARAAVQGPATATFTSYCGGIPAEPNEFRYRFSWAPRGVLTALLSPARYVFSGKETVTEHPWDATTDHTLDGERFEAYPNRDSLPFVSQYGFPGSWRLDTFIRGTLRLDGWLTTWQPVFAALRDPDPDHITALAADLAAKYPTTETDLDRVVLSVALTVRPNNGPEWSGSYLLDQTGTQTDSAMSRLVTVPLAAGITDILEGRLTPGLHRAAADPTSAQRWLAFLADHGVKPTYSNPEITE
ncbi:saccharopine dehydrogenase C-terminal domain-containing protein [Actinokineospora auranticolor]|uniref:Saccharopine dehydrogenase (NADP+, L-glutamate forming) n=1 Tax=Actinokineospora auranticolor TaxID=155976 RepID=A0A2S6GH07_9PSEU|nr:saccharopine dehydrogenase C-terminal domain-containing protein [Actinokineospora auranticolor]PPK64451.1 saccharopine dehydrogenase (NADP+, L-glutamate forming) [Actinokineospora auranticolor]